jgi:hypothetical protein
MARSARNVMPSLSNDPHDKLAAALGWHYGKLKAAPRLFFGRRGWRCWPPSP